MPLIHSFADLCALLAAEGIPHRAHAERSLVEIFGEDPEPLLLRWHEDADVFQLIQPIAAVRSPGQIATVGLQILRANHELVMPGFGLDVDRGLVYFRLTLPRQPGGALDPVDLRRAIQTVLDTVKEMGGPLRRAAAVEQASA